ncbi:MAG: glycosyltransferase, partial [Anaerolineales bacterium]
APTILLEAQASGIPVISSLHADIPHVVVDGAGGFLVPERDVDALADRLDYLLGSGHARETMGMAGRSQVTVAHNINTEARRLENRYFEVMNAR